MRVALLFAVALLSGCAVNNGYQAIQSGNLALAEQQALAAARSGDPVGYNNLGQIAMLRGNRPLAINYFTLAARMGEPTAVSNLALLGAQVPAADLAEKDDIGGALMYQAIMSPK